MGSGKFSLVLIRAILIVQGPHSYKVDMQLLYVYRTHNLALIKVSTHHYK